MKQLIAVSTALGSRIVGELQRIWADGDAFFPLDRRLPPAAAAAVLEAVRPSVLVDETGGRVRLRGGVPCEEDDALVVATSGTTGMPKGVVLSHAAVVASAQATSRRIGVDPDRDRWLACLPLGHIGGLAVVTRALVTGTPLVVHAGFDAEAVMASGATLVSLVPTALARIDPDRFRCIVLGGAVPPQELPANVVTTYGMTETGSGVVYDGRPLDGVEVRTDADGQIEVRGPMLLSCYRTASATVDPKDTLGWLATGDMGSWSPDGRLCVHGRRGDVIVTGGEKVWPDPVEQVLAGVAGVADVAVAGRPDPVWGQRVIAYVVAGPAGPPTLEQLRDAVKERLAPYCAPRQIVTVDRIPRTALGKVRRAELPS